MTQPNDDQERAHMDALFHQIFENDKRGAAVFEDLYRRFASGAKVHTNGGIDAVLKTYQDAAHREVIEYIVKRVNRHNGVRDDPQPEQGSTINERTL
jgi:hypothetical protein